MVGILHEHCMLLAVVIVIRGAAFGRQLSHSLYYLLLRGGLPVVGILHEHCMLLAVVIFYTEHSQW